jgi:hypothetical protein
MYRQEGLDPPVEAAVAHLEQGWPEGVAVPFTMHDFRREYVKENLRYLTPEERLEGLSAEDLRTLVEDLPLAERLAVLETLSVEQRLQGLPPEAIESYLQRLKNGPSSPPG